MDQGVETFEGFEFDDPIGYRPPALGFGLDITRSVTTGSLNLMANKPYDLMALANKAAAERCS